MLDLFHLVSRPTVYLYHWGKTTGCMLGRSTVVTRVQKPTDSHPAGDVAKSPEDLRSPVPKRRRGGNLRCNCATWRCYLGPCGEFSKVYSFWLCNPLEIVTSRHLQSKKKAYGSIWHLGIAMDGPVDQAEFCSWFNTMSC